MSDRNQPTGTAPQSYTIAQPVPWLWDVLLPTVAVGFLCGAFVTRYRLSCMSVIACLVFIAFFVYKVFPALRDLAFGQIDSLEGVVEKDIVHGRMGDFCYLEVPGRIKMPLPLQMTISKYSRRVRGPTRYYITNGEVTLRVPRNVWRELDNNCFYDIYYAPNTNWLVYWRKN